MILSRARAGSLFQVTWVGATDERSSIINPYHSIGSHKAPIAMEVLMHEASNRRENGPDESVCVADPRPMINERREDADKPSDVTRNEELVDIIFENITYTVSLGFRKGERPSRSLVINWTKKSPSLRINWSEEILLRPNITRVLGG